VLNRHDALKAAHEQVRVCCDVPVYVHVYSAVPLDPEQCFQSDVVVVGSACTTLILLPG